MNNDTLIRPDYIDTLLQDAEVENTFSFYSHPVTNVSPHGTYKINDIYSLIAGNTYKTQTDEHRALSLNDRAEYKKTKLDYVTFSGVFSRRGNENLISRSKWFCIDLDHTGTDKERITNADYKPALIFVSPSGDGLKVVYKIDTKAGSHESYYKALESYFSKVFGLKIDQACKDVSRACFLCHDPEPYYNPGALALGTDFLNEYGQQSGEIASQSNHGKGIQSSMKDGNTRTLSEIGLTAAEVMKVPVKMIKDARNGEKHGTLIKAARLTGGFIAGGWIDEPSAVRILEDEISQKDIISFTDAQKTIRDGIESGKQSPVDPGGNQSNKWSPNLDSHGPEVKSANLPTSTSQSQPEYFQTRTIGQVFEAGGQEPERLKIFGCFLRQQTNTLLYSNTNYGKSMLAFQIAVNAATGNSFENNEVFQNECEPMKVLLVDMELDSYTLTERHAPAWKYYDNDLLNKNLHILHENPDAPAVFGNELLKRIEEAAISAVAKLVIIDNLTKVCPDLLKADTVSIVIDTLRRIRQKTGASFLVIGHTIKTLQTTAITENSYYGSAHIGNFFTEIFYLDKTNTGDFFLKHAKTKQKDAFVDIVPVLKRGEHIRDGVGFTYMSLQPVDLVQMPHGNTIQKQKPSEYKQEIEALDRAGISQVRIAELFGCSRQAISKILQGGDTF